MRLRLSLTLILLLLSQFSEANSRCGEFFVKGPIQQQVLSASQKWIQLFEDSVTKPQAGLPMLGENQVLLENLDRRTQLSLLKRIGKLYTKAPKGEHTSIEDSIRYHMPKRILAAWVRVLLKPHQVIMDAYKIHRDPVEALQTYFDVVQKDLGFYLPENLGYGKLRARDLFYFAEEIHDVLKKDREFYRKKKIAWPERQILVFGSSMKNLARNHSDLDMALVFPGSFDHSTWVERWYTEGTPDGVLGISPRVQKYVNGKYPGFDLKTEHFSFFRTPENKFTEISFSAYESAVFEITADGIDLIVFSDKTHANAESLKARTQPGALTPRIEYEADRFERIPYIPSRAAR